MNRSSIRLGTFLPLCLLFSWAAWAQNPDLEEAKRLHGVVVELYKSGKFVEAETTCRQALAYLEKALGPDHLEVAGYVNNLAEILDRQGKFGEAVNQCQRLVNIVEKKLGPDHPDLAGALNNLGALYVRQAKYAEAEPAFQRALTILEKAGGRENIALAANINALAVVCGYQGKFAEAEPLYQRLLKMCEKVRGPNHPDVATALTNLATACFSQGKFSEAEPLYQRALKIRGSISPEHPDVAASCIDLGELYRCQGKYAEAEPLFQRGLKIRKKTLGPGHFGVAFDLASLSGLYRTQGKNAEAEPLLQQALKIIEASVGRDHAAVALFLNNLAELYRGQGKFSEAEPLFRRAVETIERAQGADHPNLATPLNNLAELYRSQGKLAAAEPLYLRSLQLLEKVLGPDHPGVTGCINNLATLYRIQKKYSEAEALFQRILTSTEKMQGPDAPMASLFHSNLAMVYADQGKYTAALKAFRQGFEILEKSSQTAGGEAFAEQIRKNQQLVCQWFLSSLRHLNEQNPEAARPFLPFAFQAMEQARSRVFLDQLLDRTAGLRSNLLPEDRQREETLDLQSRNIEALKKKETDKPAESWNKHVLLALEQQLGGIRTERKQIEEKLREKYPKYMELRKPQPISVEQVQKEILGEKEKLISYWADEERLFACIIGKESYHFLSAPVASQTLSLAVRQFRQIIGQHSNVEIFKRASHTLYKQIFAPFSGYLTASDTETIFLVPSGPCQTIPFEALIESTNGDSFANLDYLFKKYHFAYVPSAMVLRAIRKDASSLGDLREGRHPAILFGDPVYSPNQLLATGSFDPGQSGNGDRAPVSTPSLPNRGASETLAVMASFDVPLPEATSRALCRGPDGGMFLAPLPGTRIEGEEIASMYYSPDQVSAHAFFGLQAQETMVKTLSQKGILAGYQILHFATHGLLPTEAAGLSEPCLALSLYGDPENDGFLKMSEIFGLKLRADLVTLSACQTGIEDDPGKAQGLSGLARGFFYAGTSRLLVSLWSVSDVGTSFYMKKLYSLFRAGNLSCAEALNRTRAALLASEPFSHPYFWAPFILLGEWR